MHKNGYINYLCWRYLQLLPRYVKHELSEDSDTFHGELSSFPGVKKIPFWGHGLKRVSKNNADMTRSHLPSSTISTT